jgi:hypothetical protein
MKWLALLLLWPLPVLADPGTIAFILASSIEIGTLVVSVQSLLLVGAYVYGTTEARRRAKHMQADARASYNANLQDRSVTALQAIPPWRIVYGRGLTGGDIHAIFTTDKTGYREDGSTYSRPDALKHLVIVFADHEVQAINDIYIDGVGLGALDGSGFVTSGEFFSTRVDSVQATIGGGGTVTVARAVVTVLSAYTVTGAGDNYSTTDVTGSITLTGGNLTINGPAGAIVNYTVQANLASVRIQKHLGTSSQTVDTYLNSVASTEWTSTDRLLNKAYIVLTLDLENQRFQGGPPGITADITGRKIYDPRKDSTVPGGSGAHRNNNAATWEFSDNPALVIRDYLTAEWGFESPQAGINDAFTIAAANACDVRQSATAQSKADTVTASASTDLITFAADQQYGVGDGVRFTTTGTLPAGLSLATTYYLIRVTDNRNFKVATSVANAYAGTAVDITSAGSGAHTCTWFDYATYKCNGVITTTDAGKEAILDDLAESMAGFAVYGAQWEIIAGAWTATVMDLGDDDLVGQIELVQADVGMDQLLNGVRGTYIPAGKAVPIEFDNYTNSTFVAADGRELWDDRALPFTDNKARCRNLSRIFVERGRNGQMLRFPAKLKAWPLQRGDRVRVTSTEYGLSLKSYRVTDWQFGLTSPVVLTLQEDDSTVYDLADAASADPTQNTNLPGPWVVQAITGLSATSGLSTGLLASDGSWQPRIKLSWTAVTDAYLTSGEGRIIVLWRTPRGTEWQRLEVLGNETSAFLGGVREGDMVVIEVAGRNGVQQFGPPSFLSHTVTLTDNSGGFSARGNLLDPAAWVIGSTGTQGKAGGGLFTAYGSNNSVVLDTAPDGIKRAIWRGANTGASADGGFDTGDVSIDSSKTYMFWAWITPASTMDGSYFLGPGPSFLSPDRVATISTGAGVANPYFISYARSELVSGRPYLLVGYVLPSTIGTTAPTPSLGGVYDGRTGQRVKDATDFKWLSTTTQINLRTYQDSSSGTAQQDWWSPGLQMADGTEPSIDALLAVAKTGLTNNLQPDFESQYTLNGQFSNWALGASIPDGWTSIGSGATFTRETTITRTGPNAVRQTSAAAQTGVYRTIDFAGLPLAAGSFVEGTLDAYLVSHTSGGYPGLRVSLFTNSALSVSQAVLFDLPNTTSGGWQTIPFKASVSAGERIYGVQFFMSASESGFSGGLGTSTVIFDSLVARAVQPSDTAHIQPDAATEITKDAGSDTYSFTAGAGFEWRVQRLRQISWTNNSGGTLTVELSGEILGTRSSGAGSVYLDVNSGFSSMTSGVFSSINADLKHTDATSAYRRYAYVNTIDVSNGSTVYLAATTYINTAVSTTTDESGDSRLAITVIKR